MIVEADGYRIDFKDALIAFKFDETDKGKPTFHGAPMKAVDMVIELRDAYLFVEIKEYPEDFDANTRKDDKYCDEIDCPKRRDHFTWLKDYLKYKFRDTFLYRYAEGKLEKNKPIHYLCLLNFDDAQNGVMTEKLKKELPVGSVSPRWRRALATSCQVVNLSRWNKSFPEWPARKVRA